MQLPDHLFIDVEEEGLKAFRNSKWNAVDKVIMNKCDIVGEHSRFMFEGGTERDSSGLNISGSKKDIQKFLNFGGKIEKEDITKSGVDFLALSEE